MLRLIPDRTTYRWGDPITVRYEGDLDDLATWTTQRGTLTVHDTEAAIPFNGEVIYGAAFARPVLPGYVFAVDPDDGASWVGTAVEVRPAGMRTATIVGQVSTLRGPTTVSCVVGVVSRMTIGWCPSFRTGETADAAVRRMLGTYPGTSMVRIFFAASKGIGSWTSGALAAVPPDADLFVSVKDWPVPLAAWLTAMPQRAGRTFFCLDHEPEQQSGGDPLPAVYKQQWVQVAAALRGHARRDEIGLVPTFTRYYWDHNSGAYDQYFPTEVAGDLAAVGWDIYDETPSGTAAYETPASMLRTPLAIRVKTGLPFLLGEYGVERKASDPDGKGCAVVMRGMVAELSRVGCLGVAWFHVGEDDLTKPGAERIAERDTWAELIRTA